MGAQRVKSHELSQEAIDAIRQEEEALQRPLTPLEQMKIGQLALWGQLPEKPVVEE